MNVGLSRLSSALPIPEVTADSVHEHGRRKPAKTRPGEEEGPVSEPTLHGLKYINVGSFRLLAAFGYSS